MEDKYKKVQSFAKLYYRSNLEDIPEMISNIVEWCAERRDGCPWLEYKDYVHSYCNFGLYMSYREWKCSEEKFNYHLVHDEALCQEILREISEGKDYDFELPLIIMKIICAHCFVYRKGQ